MPDFSLELNEDQLQLQKWVHDFAANVMRPVAPEYDQRSRVYGWWQVFNIVGVILILILPTIVIRTGPGDYAQGVRIMGWAIVVALPLTVGLALFAVPEPVNVGAAPHGGVSAYLSLFRRPAVRKLLLADLVLGVAPGITGSLLFFFFGQIKGYDHTQASLFMLCLLYTSPSPRDS